MNRVRLPAGPLLSTRLSPRACEPRWLDRQRDAAQPPPAIVCRFRSEKPLAAIHPRAEPRRRMSRADREAPPECAPRHTRLAPGHPPEAAGRRSRAVQLQRARGSRRRLLAWSWGKSLPTIGGFDDAVSHVTFNVRRRWPRPCRRRYKGWRGPFLRRAGSFHAIASPGFGSRRLRSDDRGRLPRR